MKILMIGTGYVGVVSEVCFADFGHEVVRMDKEPRTIEMLERGEVPIDEAGRRPLTLDLQSAIDGAPASRPMTALEGLETFLDPHNHSSVQRRAHIW